MKLWGGEVELVALSKLYSRSIIVYNEQENGVQEQVFPCTEEERASSADDLANPVGTEIGILLMMTDTI